MWKSKILKSTGLVVVLAFMLTSPFCWTATRVIYSDDFSGTGTLNGKAPDVRPGQETWIAASVFGANGTVSPDTLDGYTYQAWLPISLEPGKTYTLSLDVDPQESTDSSTWFALGFSNSNVTASLDLDDQFWSTGIAWVLHRVTRAREENDEIQTFLGPGMTEIESHESKEEGLVTLSVVLDTTAIQWTVEWFRNNQSIRGPVAFTTNPEISYVGFTKFWVTAGIVDNFVLKLTEYQYATVPSPYDGAKDVLPEVILTWIPGVYVEGLSPKHRIFISENFEDVNNGVGGVEQDAERYPINGTLSLDLGKTYYWRIDEANNITGWDLGAVWQFKVVNYLVVDDFEGYSDDVDNRVFQTWLDGVGYKEPEYYGGNDTGSAVGNSEAPYMETDIVHSGAQSVPIRYDNTGAGGKVCYSEAKRTWDVPQNWTRKGVKALSLWFRGYPEYLGGFSEGPAGTYTMRAEGADIWSTSDEFHFAWQQLSGAGSITAKIESVQNTHEWAKAGVMIRDNARCKFNARDGGHHTR